MNNKNFKTGQYVIVEGKCEGVKHDGRLLINFFGENPELTAVYPKNVLPKPQKVVIPKIVAEWIKDNKSGIGTLHTAYALLGQRKNDVSLWVNSNQDTFARAWLDGYEVEKEKLYTVEIPDPNADEYRNRFVLGRMEGKVCIKQVSSTTWEMNCSNQLTESEIKQDFDWAWEFAKPVEEE
ncbi:DUF1642 domain-containing protein [Streptococcus equi subsp. zooepidemicus]|uniref:DUF1642 domain-containing protein n=1 Tax=Streptococcus equi TaxID=1336 RepID=UPI001E48C497|nr:DUF1642 domain-containing protein [Streptococcus equi]MCD3414373.1 DUF1642 domain-containing protein [Streptococcus equi subsp. zooepidemicus]